MSSDFSDLPEAPRGSIHARLLASHLFIAGMGVTLLLVALYVLHDISRTTEGIAKKLGPESEAYLHILSGVERAIADVFAFTVLEDEALRQDRALHWSENVPPSMQRLKSLVPPGDEGYTALEGQLALLDTALKRAEDLAASSENIPSEVIYVNEIRPLLDSLKSNFLSARESLRQAAAEDFGQAKRLGDISYAWGAIAVSEGAFRDFLQFGTPGEEMLFRYWTDETAGALESIATADGANAEKLAEPIHDVLGRYREACARAIAARKAPDWNQALYLFKNEVNPLASEVIEILQAQAFERSSETLRSARRLDDTTSRALIGLVVMGTLIALFGIWIAGRQSAQIAGPLIELAQAARDLADQKYSRDIDVARNDEIGFVVASFNAMRHTLRTRRAEVEAAQNALRASEERYRMMVEISPTPYLSASEGKVVYMNEAALELCGEAQRGLGDDEAPTLSKLFGDETGKAMEDYAANLTGDGAESEILDLAAELNGIQRHLELRGAKFQLFGNDAVLFSIHDVTEREIDQRRLRRLSDVDALTEVPNRRALDDQLKVQWATACAAESPLAFILVDIDHFKKYNDNYGHQAGDDCLRQVATLLNSSIRAGGDLLARYGGEEFAYLLPSTGGTAAEAVANRALEAIRNAAIPHAHSDTAEHVTISMGVYALVPTTEMTMSSLIEKADGALYEAKENGRNRVVVA